MKVQKSATTPDKSATTPDKSATTPDKSATTLDKNINFMQIYIRNSGLTMGVANLLGIVA